MALIKCPECNAYVSDFAQTCPKCGFPMKFRWQRVFEKSEAERKENERRELEKRIEEEKFQASIKPSGSVWNHEYVDFCLPSGLLWAVRNIGADKPEASGNIFSWGQTNKGCINYNLISTDEDDFDDHQFHKYNKKDKLIILKPEDDTATAIWGGGWRMPTKEDFSELKRYGKWKYDPIHYGFKYTGLNGRSVFFPFGFYWSSSLSQETQAFGLDLKIEDHYATNWDIDYRHYRNLIRAVCKKQ